MTENHQPRVSGFIYDPDTKRVVPTTDEVLKFYSKKRTVPDISLDPSISTKLVEEKGIPDISTKISGETPGYTENKPRRVIIRARILP
jgi:ribosomal protein L31E